MANYQSRRPVPAVVPVAGSAVPKLVRVKRGDPTLNAQRNYLNARLDAVGRFHPPKDFPYPTPERVLKAQAIVAAHRMLKEKAEQNRNAEYSKDLSETRQVVMFKAPDDALADVVAFEKRWPK